MKKLALVLIYSALIALVYPQNLPELTGRVVDITGTLSAVEKNDIETFLENFENSTGAQMVVAIIDTLDGYSIEEYSIELAEKWKIGRKGIDDGVIILVSLGDRKIRIEVGYGLEGTITDVLAWRVIEKDIKPHFINGDYYLGLKSAVISLAELVGYQTDNKNAYIDNPIYKSKIMSQNIDKYKNKLFFPVLALCYALGLGIRRSFKSLTNYRYGAVPKIALFILAPIAALLLIALFIVIQKAAFIFLVAMILGTLGSTALYLLASGAGGGSSGGGGGSFGGGGFSGGGGSFGGGGSSGSW